MTGEGLRVGRKSLRHPGARCLVLPLLDEWAGRPYFRNFRRISRQPRERFIIESFPPARLEPVDYANPSRMPIESSAKRTGYRAAKGLEKASISFYLYAFHVCVNRMHLFSGDRSCRAGKLNTVCWRGTRQSGCPAWVLSCWRMAGPMDGSGKRAQSIVVPVYFFERAGF